MRASRRGGRQQLGDRVECGQRLPGREPGFEEHGEDAVDRGEAVGAEREPSLEQ